MAFAHGRKGKVTVDGIVLCVKKWEASIKKTKHDTSSTCNNEWQQFQVGKKVLEFTIDAELDLANSPLDSGGPNVLTDFVDIELFVDGDLTATYTATTVVDDFKITSAQDAIINYTITGTSTGTVTISS